MRDRGWSIVHPGPGLRRSSRRRIGRRCRRLRGPFRLLDKTADNAEKKTRDGKNTENDEDFDWTGHNALFDSKLNLWHAGPTRNRENGRERILFRDGAWKKRLRSRSTAKRAEAYLQAILAARGGREGPPSVHLEKMSPEF